MAPKKHSFNAQDAIEAAWVLGYSLVPFAESESRRFEPIYTHHEGLLMGNWREHPMITGHTFYRKYGQLFDPDTLEVTHDGYSRITDRFFLALRNG